MPGLARRGPRDRGLGEPLDAQPARSRASRPGCRAALPLEARARSPAPGTHRVRDARQPEADDRRARRAVGARSQAFDRRLRHGILVALVPAPPADRRDQDRPLVRHRHGRGWGGPHHRPLHDRSRAQPRPRRRGGGRGDAGGMGAAPSAGLHLGPGLLPQPGPAARGAERMAPRAPADAVAPST